MPRLPLRPLAAAIVTLALSLAGSPAGAVELAGSWSGTWASTTTGHSGPLRATFTPCGGDRYAVEFSGRFFRILPFRYSVTLRVVEDRGDHVILAGSSWLGRLFGTFRYRADATERSFEACYTSQRDRGTFRLSRCGG
jgi:hypothetical protein